jgi:hypothetical protein
MKPSPDSSNGTSILLSIDPITSTNGSLVVWNGPSIFLSCLLLFYYCFVC